ncbi:TerD family protein [Streptomyces sp. SAJ15]|uniref:TerD family protein n=1 Tax=Streptomyces sp. SAJ15 TaxID=2011095 RepID=UPI001185F99B|nr:TerD family protein [Streptomyces sp. SAJ15]TVL91792.1 DNA polymerase III [Streptomyces sp. SAJ15]
MTLSSAAHAVPDLRDYAFDWALVDVETSGLTPRQHRVLSIAVVTIGPDGEQTGEFSTLLNPGCDPGPVHVHGLTAERLRGAPTFEQVVGRVGALLEGRVMVAHNAQFDYDFLAHEFARAGSHLPVARRLCTLALNRRVDPPTSDMRLGTLAAHYGVPQTQAHDALDDTRVLAGILRASLREAARLDLALPLVACPPRQDPRFAPKPPKTPCAFRNPGRWAPGGPLVQGMKISITGDTATSRAELVTRSVAAGLNVMGSVSRHTSALVTNDSGSGSAKARRAAAEGVPIIDEPTFLTLLGEVRPGTPHERPSAATPPHTPHSEPPAAPPATPPMPAPPTAATPAAPATVPPTAPGEPAPPTPAAPVPAARRPVPPVDGRPLAGRRVLVLGGVHRDAAAARARVVELGGSAAVNLSASVTDVVLLPGGETDRRMRRIAALELPTHDAPWLDAPTAALTPRAGEWGAAPQVLPRGGVTDLPGSGLPSADASAAGASAAGAAGTAAPGSGASAADAAGTGAPSANAPVTGATGRWDVTASWAQQTHCEIDLVAFAVDEDGQVSCDEDFVFYGAPESPNGAVRLLGDGPTEQTVAVDLAALPPATRKVVVAAAIDGAASFGDVGAVQITTAPGVGAAALTQATLDAATTERTMLLAEIYRRGPVWRFRAVGQGYDHGLDDLARGYGVDIAD